MPELEQGTNCKEMQKKPSECLPSTSRTNEVGGT